MNSLDWHIATLEATKEAARSIWQNEQLAFYRELQAMRSKHRVRLGSEELPSTDEPNLLASNGGKYWALVDVASYRREPGWYKFWTCLPDPPK